MQALKRTTGVGLWMLVLSVALVFASMTVATSFAQTSNSTSKWGSMEEELGPSSGDPDMPTGDTPPSSGSGSTGSIDNGTGITLHSSQVASGPSKRYGMWAHWKFALKLYLRGFGLR